MSAYYFLSVRRHLSSGLVSWHGETKTFPHVRFKTRGSICSFTNFFTQFSLGISHFHPTTRPVQSSGRQRMMSMHGLMVTVCSLCFVWLWLQKISMLPGRPIIWNHLMSATISRHLSHRVTRYRYIPSVRYHPLMIRKKITRESLTGEYQHCILNSIYLFGIWLIARMAWCIKQ